MRYYLDYNASAPIQKDVRDYIISTLEITTKKDIKILDESELLKSKSSKNNIFNYLLASGDFNLLKDILNEIDEFSDEIISYQLNE